jgi:hypothetical protein
MKRLMLVSAIAAFALAVPALALAGGGGGKHHGPPPAAFDVCKDKAEGDACTFKGRKGTVEGTCQPARKVEALVCKGPHRGK